MVLANQMASPPLPPRQPAVAPPPPPPPPQVTPPPTAVHLTSGQEVVQNHEDRLQQVEAVAQKILEGFPHLADSLGVSRTPHQFSTDDMSGVVFDPNAANVGMAIARLETENKLLQAKLDAIFDRLPAPPGASGPIVNPGEGAA